MSLDLGLYVDKVADIFQHVGRSIKLPDEEVAGMSWHSIRLGATQDLLALNIDLASVMQEGRWAARPKASHMFYPIPALDSCSSDAKKIKRLAAPDVCNHPNLELTPGRGPGVLGREAADAVERNRPPLRASTVLAPIRPKWPRARNRFSNLLAAMQAGIAWKASSFVFSRVNDPLNAACPPPGATPTLVFLLPSSPNDL